LHQTELEADWQQLMNGRSAMPIRPLEQP
jgi:hypothetical protein